MATYGYDFYAKSVYGPDVAVQYSVAPVVAVPAAPGQITLTWGPSDQDGWTDLRVVRNPFGRPSDSDDGQIVLELPQSEPRRVFADSDLVPGRVYYYSIFLASPFPEWDSTIEYRAGMRVSLAGVNYEAVATSINITPGTSSSTWSVTAEGVDWVRAGEAATLSVTDHGYPNRLYKWIPSPYRVGQAEITGYEEGVTNPQLFKFLSIFGHQLNELTTLTDLSRNINAVDTIPARNVIRAAYQLGVDGELGTAPQRQRLHVRNATMLARSRGTADGATDLVKTITGWNSEITPSRNLMADQDQSNFFHPLYLPWDANVTYESGEIVTYGAYLYTAVNDAAITYLAYLLDIAEQTAPLVTITPSSSSASTSGKFRRFDSSRGDHFALEFDIAVGAEYDVSIKAVDSDIFGIVEYQIDGVASVAGRVDHYAHRAPGAKSSTYHAHTIYLGRYNLTSGTHTITVTVVDKNIASSAYKAGLAALTATLASGVSGLGTSPSGTTSSNDYWEPILTPLDTYWLVNNPLTNYPSTWALQNLTTGTYSPYFDLGVEVGVQDQFSGLWTANAGYVDNSSGSTATLGVKSIASALSSLWFEDVLYNSGEIVSHDDVLWQAQIPNIDVEPGTDSTIWAVSHIVADSAIPDRSLVQGYGVPIIQRAAWSPTVAYQAGDQVRHSSWLYTAISENQGHEPAGSGKDNTWWRFDGPEQQAYTASAYAQTPGSTTLPTSVFLDWYDSTGQLVGTVRPLATGLPTYQRFDEATPALNGTTGNTRGFAWTAANWAVSAGVAAPLPAGIGTGNYLTFAVVNPGSLVGKSMGVTFRSRPSSGASAEQGIVFGATSNLSTYYLASRTRLTKTTNGNTPTPTHTVLASWAEIQDGGRIYVTVTSTQVQVFRYQGPGLVPLLLASVSVTWASNTRVGLLERGI